MCIAVTVGEFYRTRGGNKAFIGAKNPFPDAEPDNIYIGWVRENNGDQWPTTWNAEGHFDPDLKKSADDDLMEIWLDPIHVKFFVNVYRGQYGLYTGPETYETLEEAEREGKAREEPGQMFPYVKTLELTDTVIPPLQFLGEPVDEKETDEEEPDAITVAEFKAGEVPF